MNLKKICYFRSSVKGEILIRFASILLLLLVCSISSFALEFSVEKTTRLVFDAAFADLRVVGAGSSPLVKILGVTEGGQFGEFQIDKSSDRVVIRMNRPRGEEYQAWINSQKTLPIIELTIPDMAIDVHLTKGKVKIQKLGGLAFLSLDSGRAELSDLRAGAQLFLGSGEVQASKIASIFHLDSFNAEVLLTQIDGDAEVKLHSGKMQMNSSRGGLRVLTSEAGISVKEFSGTIRFDSRKSNVNIADFSGRIDGQMREGALSLGEGIENAEIHVQSQSGKLLANSKLIPGALVQFVSTKDSEMILPSDMKPAKVGQERRFKSKLSGEGSGVHLVFKTQDGNIILK